MGRLEYPKDIREFRRRFSTLRACRDYLTQSQWRHSNLARDLDSESAASPARTGQPESTVEAFEPFLRVGRGFGSGSRRRDL